MVPPTTEPCGSSVTVILSSEFKNFSAKIVDTTDSWLTLLLEWPAPLTLTDYNKIAVHQLQLFPLHHVPHGYSMDIRSNLIGGSVYNPRDILMSIFVPKHSRSIPNFGTIGESCMNHNYPIHLLIYKQFQPIIISN